jgi:DNA ligase (NAD+)
MKIEGFGESRANQIVTEIRKCLNTTPDKMLKSFGISGIGNTISKTLTNLYSMDELFTMPAEKFVDIEGMGLVLSNNLVDGLRKNLPLYLFLLTRGLEFKELDSNKFKGKSFTLTGKSTMKRDDIVNFIESNGGMVKSISKTTSYLVTNDPNSSSSKTKKAREYGTKIISYDELMNF